MKHFKNLFLVQTMKNHQDPKPNSLAERFQFNYRDWKSRVNSRIHCRAEAIGWTFNYDTIIQDMLQDRLVCGLKHERIQQCLLGEGDLLTLEKKDWYSASHGVTIKQSLLIRSTEGVEEHLESIHKFKVREN